MISNDVPFSCSISFSRTTVCALAAAAFLFPEGAFLLDLALTAGRSRAVMAGERVVGVDAADRARPGGTTGGGGAKLVEDLLFLGRRASGDSARSLSTVPRSADVVDAVLQALNPRLRAVGGCEGPVVSKRLSCQNRTGSAITLTIRPPVILGNSNILHYGIAFWHGFIVHNDRPCTSRRRLLLLRP